MSAINVAYKKLNFKVYVIIDTSKLFIWKLTLFYIKMFCFELQGVHKVFIYRFCNHIINALWLYALGFDIFMLHLHIVIVWNSKKMLFFSFYFFKNVTFINNPHFSIESNLSLRLQLVFCISRNQDFLSFSGK